MNIYSLLPLLALLINIFVTVFILAQKRNSRLNRAFAYYTINLSFWIFSEIIVRQDIPREYIALTFKFASIFWMALGFWFLNFSYEFTDKKKDSFYFATIILLIISIAISLGTDLVVAGHDLFYWGPDEQIGFLFLPLLTITNLAPIIYGLYLIVNYSSNAENRLIKKSSPLIVYGTVITILTAFFSNVVLPHIFDIHDSFQFAESITVVQSLFIFVAVFKYRLFGLGVEDISYNLFSTMRDGVIITDNTFSIIHMNESAEDLFNVRYADFNYENIDLILSNISLLKENERVEKVIRNGELIVLITKSRITQFDEYFGYMFYIKDITVRKNAEQELIEKESTFSELFESSPDALIVIDTDGNIAKTNRQVKKLFDYEPDELINENIEKLIPNKFRETHIKYIKAYKANPVRREMGVDLELYVLTKNDKEIPVEVMLSPLTRNHNKMTLATIRDITKRKLSEQKLIESERNHRSLVLNHPHGIIETLFDGTITLVNNAYAHLYELETEDLIGKKVWEIHEDQEFMNRIKKFLEISEEGTSVPKTEISNRKTKSSKEIEIQIDWNYKLDALGNKIGHVTVVTDITEIRKIEKRFNKYRLMLSQAEKLTHLGSWEWNRKTDELFWSDELYRIYGLKKNHFQPSYEKYQELIHPEDKFRVISTIEHSIQTGLSFFHFEKIMRPNGEFRILSTRGITQKNKQEEVTGIYGSCLDVTEFKNIERELRVSQKQLRALSSNLQSTREEERMRIAREIHDELGQVLTAINMDIGLMIDELADEGSIPKDTLYNNLYSIEGLIEQLIKSVQNISTELRPDVLDHLGLIPAIEWQLQEFEQRFKIKTVLERRINNIEFEDQKKIGIFRIFQETLTNVARHAKASEVKAILCKTDGFFEMQVIDNGVGISQESIEDIKSIGLIGMKERVLLLGGKIIIKRVEDGGTELYLKVPIA